MTINSTQKRILETLFEQEKVTKNNILSENDKKVRNVHLRKQAMLLSQVLPRIPIQTTEFENMGALEIDGVIRYIYKEWELHITDISAVSGEILSSIILPYITYNIIYEEAEDNDLDFYNTELDLQQTSFYEVQNGALILHISAYMTQYTGGKPLIVPRARVILNFQNPFKILK